MPTLWEIRLPEPPDPVEFEKLVRDIFRHKWKDPSTQLYGRSGQDQQGVDVHGRSPDSGGGYVGVQCKRYDKKLTKDLIETEIKMAEEFKPPLSHYIIATTAPRDARLDKDIRLINEERKDRGKFGVEILYWSDLEEELKGNWDILRTYYPDIYLLYHGYDPAAIDAARAPATAPRFRSNIPARRALPFVGRDSLLDDILKALGDPATEGVLVLHGPPGVGKSGLAREFARRGRDRYPGGTFFVDASAGAAPLDLARIGANILDLDFPPGLALPDQCEQALLSLGSEPTLLIYDNAVSLDSRQPWLPPAGMPCHVLITAIPEPRTPGWPSLAVPPLSPATSMQLIEALAGTEVVQRHGRALAALAGGLPIQICPAAATLAYEARRGRLASVSLAPAREARDSFGLVYGRLEPGVRLLLHAAAFLNCQRIARNHLLRHLQVGAGWSEEDFYRSLDPCLDLHLLEDGAELRLHQLFAAFVLDTPLPDDGAATLEKTRHAQRDQLVEVANELVARPASSELAAALTVYSLAPAAWDAAGAGLSIEDGEAVGRALCEIGRFEEARPWYERAVAAKEQGDVHGRVDHDSLGRSLHQVGYCLSSVGRFEEARPWYERAVVAAEQGDVHGRVDHDSLGRSLQAGAECLRRTGRLDQAREWEDRAASLAAKPARP